jgi:hypothetical protein
MRTPTVLSTLAACLLLLALPAASAYANAADNRIIEDCQTSATGALTGSYPKAQLNHALHNLPGDVREYTGCFDAIRQALLAGGGGGGGSGGGDTAGSGSGGAGGGGSFGAGSGGGPGTGGAGAPGETPNAPPPPGAEKPVEIAGTTVAPGALPVIGTDSHRLPTALLVLLVLLAGAALAGAALTIGHRVVARRRA